MNRFSKFVTKPKTSLYYFQYTSFSICLYFISCSQCLPPNLCVCVSFKLRSIVWTLTTECNRQIYASTLNFVLPCCCSSIWNRQQTCAILNVLSCSIPFYFFSYPHWLLIASFGDNIFKKNNSLFLVTPPTNQSMKYNSWNRKCAFVITLNISVSSLYLPTQIHVKKQKNLVMGKQKNVNK